MGMSWTALFILCLLCLVAQGHAIPASTAKKDCSSELVRLKKGDPLSLECGSDCTVNHNFRWWKAVEGTSASHRNLVEGESGASLYRNAASLMDGGTYTCQCTNGPECQYNVTILPEIDFTASEEATHYGDSLDLSCTVESFPATFPEIRDSRGAKVHNQIVKTLEPFKTMSFAIVPDAEDMDYTCHVEVHSGGRLAAQEEKQLHVQLYDPPYIVYTTEYTVHDPSDYGKPGLLTCVVDTSPETAIKVSWWTRGMKLENSNKYKMDFEKTKEDDVLAYRLQVNDIQDSDVDSYLCQVATEFAIEDSQHAWIKTDFRKATLSQKSPQAEGSSGHQINEMAHQAGRFGVVSLTVYSLSLLTGAVALYWCVARRRQGLHDHGKKDRSNPTHALPVTDYGYHVGVMKRK